jgi:hypothetical protein
MVSKTPYDFPVCEFFDFIKSGNKVQKNDIKDAVVGIIRAKPIVKNNIQKMNMYSIAHPQWNTPHISPSFQFVSFLESSFLLKNRYML